MIKKDLKNLIIIFLIATLLAGISGCGTQKNTNTQPDTNKSTDMQTTSTNKEIDASDLSADEAGWKAYTNDKYGYEIKHPEDWEVEMSNNKVFISSSDFREGMPEGGGSVIIEVRKVSLEDFIEEYNSSSIVDGVPLAEIIAQEEYTLDGVLATRLVGTTAIGLNNDYIFVKKNINSYIIGFHSFDNVHLDIVSSFKFLKD